MGSGGRLPPLLTLARSARASIGAIPECLAVGTVHERGVGPFRD
jgi:hypothetical protein